MIALTEDDLKELHQRVLQLKMDELFEEPSTYEDDDDDDGLVHIYWIFFSHVIHVYSIYVWPYYWIYRWFQKWRYVMSHLLGIFLIALSIPFVVATLYFGSKRGSYYDSDDYKGNGTAH